MNKHFLNKIYKIKINIEKKIKLNKQKQFEKIYFNNN